MKHLKAKLEFPNVALPWHQQLAMRVYMGPFVANASDPSKNRRIYEGYSQRITELASAIPFEKHNVPVLVPSQVGLLDDTRYWSLTMTFEHLLKLDSLTKEIILKLARNEAPEIKITPALVAPTGKADPASTFEAYQLAITTHLDEIDSALATSKSILTEAHPFFGNFNARQWQWSMAARTGLRFRQIKNICKGLISEAGPDRRLSLLPESPGA